MKNSANPVLNQDLDTIEEYPINKWRNLRPEKKPNFSNFVHEVDEEAESEPWLVLEASDWGHRHFSSLHWLYPGTFSPSTPRGLKILNAAKNTLQRKVASGGGHTGQVVRQDLLHFSYFLPTDGPLLGSLVCGQGCGILARPGLLCGKCSIDTLRQISWDSTQLS
jgi:hypothetical protein